MAHQQVMQKLVLLQKQSAMRLPDSLITGLTKSLTQARYQLIRAISNPTGAGFIIVPTNGTASLLSTVQSRRLLWTAKEHDGFLQMLNKELQGGDEYPILSAAVGEGVGLLPVVGTAISLLFSAVSAGVDLAKTSHTVIARAGDQVWQIEEIGKVGTRVVHVGSYWVVDPYRKQAPEKGWLIHEERTELTLQ